jgi:hypothetical protein
MRESFLRDARLGCRCSGCSDCAESPDENGRHRQRVDLASLVDALAAAVKLDVEAIADIALYFFLEFW